jgi:hypothetical protein
MTDKTDDLVRNATAYIDDVLASQARLGYRSIESNEAYDRAVRGAAAPLRALAQAGLRHNGNGSGRRADHSE